MRKILRDEKRGGDEEELEEVPVDDVDEGSNAQQDQSQPR